MDPILLIVVAVLLICLAYYITIRVTKNETLAFVVAAVVILLELAYRGMLG